MDKETFIKYLNNNNLSIEIIYEYCIEKGKKPEDISQLLIAIRTIDPFGNLLSSCMSDAINYYKNKFNITSIVDNTGKILINY